jgi:hypothetical protein
MRFEVGIRVTPFADLAPLSVSAENGALVKV